MCLECLDVRDCVVWHLVKQTGHRRHDILQLHPVYCTEEMERDRRQLALWPLAQWTEQKHCWLRDEATSGQTALGWPKLNAPAQADAFRWTVASLHHVTCVSLLAGVLLGANGRDVSEPTTTPKKQQEKKLCSCIKQTFQTERVLNIEIPSSLNYLQCSSLYLYYL